jgi:lipoprotein-releasing system ATP-binding protein
MADTLNAGGGLETAGPDPLIIGRGLSKGFENNGLRIEVIQDTSFAISGGETIAVVGASGIGKSTFLQVIGALDPPDRGTLLLEGRDVYALGEIPLAQLRNQTIGFVFQFHHLLPEFSALENVMMPGLIRRDDSLAARQVAEEMLVRVGLANRLDHRPSELSGGEQQRVAIARALVLNPLVLLADEPTGNLDEKTSGRIHELLLELNGELSMTLIVATHNAHLARLMSRNLTIVEGKIVEIGDISETEG